MKRLSLVFAPVLLCGAMALGCNTATQSRDVSTDIRHSLDQAGLNDVSVSQDRDKGVVSLGGHVSTEADKSQAESVAKSFAPEQVVANQISVEPAASDLPKIQSSLDDGIESNLDAALTQNKLKNNVDYAVKNGVVTLSGDVRSPQTRAQAAAVAQSVPNVKQVVNELQVKDQKATSSK